METGTEGDDTSEKKKKTEEETEAERETGGQAESGRNNVSKREKGYGRSNRNKHWTERQAEGKRSVGGR